MILVAPYNTDAPVYHYPIATGVIIAINVVVFFLTTLQVMVGNVEPESVHWLCLEFSNINPVQWITAAFMHGDPLHLIGNMIFLWAFGLVVEGKVGSKVFVLIYLLVAMASMALIQIPMFLMGSVSIALGASGVIFGLMAISVIWAPENEMGCFYWIGLIWWGTFEIRIVSLGMIYIALQIITIWLTDFSMSGAMGHMAGVVMGAPVALYMLRSELVDCEGWDLVTRTPWMHAYPILCGDRLRRELKKQKQDEETDANPIAAALAIEGKMGTASAAKIGIRTAPAKKAPSSSVANRAGKKKKLGRAESRTGVGVDPSVIAKAKQHPEFNRLTFLMRQSMDANDWLSTNQAFMQLDQKKLGVALSEKLLVRYIGFAGTHKQWSDSIRPLQLVVSGGGEHAEDAKLRIARIQLQALQKPDLAVRTLQTLESLKENPTEAEKKRANQKAELLAVADRMLDEQLP